MRNEIVSHLLSLRVPPEGRDEAISGLGLLASAKPWLRYGGAGLRRPVGLLAMTVLLGALIFFFPLKAHANDDANFSYISRGFYRILTAAFQIPQYLIQKTLSEPIGLGTIDGALSGTYYAVAELSGGVLDIARGVVPYAKYLIFFI